MRYPFLNAYVKNTAIDQTDTINLQVLHDFQKTVCRRKFSQDEARRSEQSEALLDIKRTARKDETKYYAIILRFLKEKLWKTRRDAVSKAMLY